MSGPSSRLRVIECVNAIDSSLNSVVIEVRCLNNLNVNMAAYVSWLLDSCMSFWVLYFEF